MTNSDALKNSVSLEAGMIAALGGPSIFAMAFNLCVKDDANRAVTFHVAPGLKRTTKGKCDRVTITLASDDTYSVSTGRYNRRTFDYVVCESLDGVYADSLRRVVEDMTGLRMTLGTMGAR